jgi:hypothetical protein
VRVRRKGELLRVDFHPSEVELLGVLLDDLESLLAGLDTDDPVVQRLFPDGYTDDAGASAEFASLVAGDLRDDRAARIGACRAELPPRGGQVSLDAEAADRWIRVINDLRLSVGTRIGVTEEDELDPTDQAAALYHLLSATQEILVEHLMA